MVRLMTKKKIYAVKVGKIPGIYYTWTETEQQVKNFPGSVFKSFSSEEDAIRYMSDKEITRDLNDEINVEEINKKIKQEIDSLSDDEVIAFVDGSYSKSADDKEKYSFGVILLTKGSEDSLYKAFVQKSNIESRNIAGEIEGVKQAISWSISRNKKRIKIFYDYVGIEKWATKKWKTKTKISKEYVKFFEENSKSINIEFEHVKAHSGIEYNEKADELAKKALLAKGYKTYDDGSVYFNNFNKEDWFDIVKSLNSEFYEKSNNHKIEVSETRQNNYLENLKLTFNNQKVIINCYKGNKSYLQGKQSELLEKIIALAIEKLPNDNQVIEILNSYRALTIDEISVENEFSLKLPNFPDDNKDIKLRNVLLTAVFNTKIVGYMPDYTFLITPIFRAMEYYLHRILHDKLGCSTTKKNRSGDFLANNFSFFDKDKKTKKFKYNRSSKSLNSDQIDYLNELYNRYYRIRHPYSHWPEKSIDAMVISDIKTAHDIILEELKFINTI